MKQKKNYWVLIDAAKKKKREGSAEGEIFI